MNKVYVIRCEETTDSGNKFHSYLLKPSFSTYRLAYEYLENVIKEDREYYIDGGWEEEDVDEKLIWNKDPNETWVKWDFFDEYTIYYIEEMEVKDK